MAKKKEPEGNSGGNSGTHLIPQPHGGALLSGGVVGHKGGPGRPPAQLRGDFRDVAELGIDVLRGYVLGRVPVKMVGQCEKCGHEHEDYSLMPDELEALLGNAPKDSDRLKAIDTAAKYGGVQDLALVAEEMPESRTPDREDAKRVWDRVRRIESIEEMEKFLVENARKQLEEGT
jgi:hypothetical protein